MTHTPPIDSIQVLRGVIWVPNAHIHPTTKIWGRMWRTPDRKTSGTFGGSFPMGVNAATVEWRFANDDGGEG